MSIAIAAMSERQVEGPTRFRCIQIVQDVGTLSKALSINLALLDSVLESAIKMRPVELVFDLLRPARVPAGRLASACLPCGGQTLLFGTNVRL